MQETKFCQETRENKCPSQDGQDKQPVRERDSPSTSQMWTISLVLGRQARDGSLTSSPARGTASRQKGFRGCIRALQLNGVTLDLEERARITPGVQAGCPGHCSSYGSLCQNQGRCVERTRSFSCSCGPSAFTGAFCDREVSASFKARTSISYTLEEQAAAGPSRSSGVASSISSDVTLRAENISLSFRTNQSPSLLLYVGSSHREYLALLLDEHEKLEVRYRLDSSRDAEILRSKSRSLADGRLHTVSISRRAEAVSVQQLILDLFTSNIREQDTVISRLFSPEVHSPDHEILSIFVYVYFRLTRTPEDDFNLTSDLEFNGIRLLTLGRVHQPGEMDPELARLGSLGFTGCLSAVLFNSISPLKAALLHPDTSPVTVTGPLVPSLCGSTSTNPHAAETTHHRSGQSGPVETGQPLVNAMRTDSALIGGVIAVVIFVAVAALAVTARLLYGRPGACQSQDIKRVKPEDGPELPFSSQSNNIPSENQREFFI
ncbi:unnamed protein product [Pleuronectes platessa]|uniref:Uncharacterized protein n=1 Tax=Pleuronectes platessa TaxID=8262 RepID=A0A9N7Y6V6_PLEPL|nr:unnamed protein product [Pleuronectes platessa]